MKSLNDSLQINFSLNGLPPQIYLWNVVFIQNYRKYDNLVIYAIFFKFSKLWAWLTAERELFIKIMLRQCTLMIKNKQILASQDNRLLWQIIICSAVLVIFETLIAKNGKLQTRFTRGTKMTKTNSGWFLESPNNFRRTFFCPNGANLIPS